MATEENQATDDATSMVSSDGAAKNEDDNTDRSAGEASETLAAGEPTSGVSSTEINAGVEPPPASHDALVAAAPSDAPPAVSDSTQPSPAPAQSTPPDQREASGAGADGAEAREGVAADGAAAESAAADGAAASADGASADGAAAADDGAGGESAAAADDGAGGDDAAEDDAGDDDAAEDAGDEANADAQGAGDGSGEPGKKKRRRRRRRKKKGPEGEASPDDAAGADGAASGAASGPAKEPREARPRKDKPPRKKPVERERPAFNVGDQIFGRVSKVTKDALWLDVAGGKALGLYDRSELIQIPPKEGEQFIARVKSLSTRGGMLMLGRELFDTAAARTELRAALQAGAPLDCWVTGVIKGGLEVDYKGVRCFAPASHVELKSNADLSGYLGEPMPFVVTQYGKKGRDVVVSRKAMMEEEHGKVRDEHLAKLEPEMEVKAVVRTVLEWGAFVSLPEHGDVEGVVHMTEASHDRSARLSDIFQVGGEISVKVLKIDERKKLWLSHKATLDDPWEAAREKYPVGSRHTLKVVRLTDFGAFIQLEPGIDGLCHVADLSFNVVNHPSDVLKVGQDIDVVVANVDAKAKKVTLHPAPPDDEKDVPPIKRLAPHQTVDVVVMQIRENGLGVRIIGATGRRARGYIPAGATGTPRGTDLRKTFPLGHRMEAKVIEIDRRGEAKLSIRALKEDAEKQAYREYRKKVQREATFGTFADLLKGKI